MSEIEYTPEEEELIEDCLEHYLANNMRANVNPDDWKTVKKAMAYSHRKGEVIRDKKTHALQRAIMRKNGEIVEENEDRQRRLVAERVIARSENRKKILAKDQAEAEIRLRAAEVKVKDFEHEISLADLKRKGASERELAALEKAKKAEDEVIELRNEMKEIKELLKNQLQDKTNMKNMEVALTELAKEGDAVLVADEPKPEAPVPETIPPSEKPEAEEPEEKTIEDLIKELKE